VSGWPWATRVAVEWCDFDHTLDGKPFANQGVHFIDLRWGRTAAIHIDCDTDLLKQVLRRNAVCGLAEALAEPILD
jgi:ketosteroid isomerase-like protein